MAGFLERLGPRAAAAGRRIVLVEGHDPRVQDAARRLRAEGHLEPTLIVEHPDGRPTDWEGPVRSPASDPELSRYAELYREARQEADARSARDRLRDPLYFAGSMVGAGDADGAVAGASNSTASVIRAAIRCLGTAPGVRTVSGAFYMVVPPFRGEAESEVLTFTDAGSVPEPGIDQLVEIAGQAAIMRRRIVGDEPRLAFLSYSTKGSAEGPSVAKMRQALAAFREAHPDVAADGEFQVDAALVEEVAARKAPGSDVAGRANILVFPDLGSGNIAYKLVERLCGAAAIGPILHGLRRPFNDLSRGASVDSIVWVAYVTALMAGDLDSAPGDANVE